MKKLTILLSALLVLTTAGISGATTLTFDHSWGLGVSTSMDWHPTGGGHIFLQDFSDDDWLVFIDEDTYVNDFQMNYYPWEGYENGNGDGLYITAHDSQDQVVWSETIYLEAYKNWSNWLTVSVETDHVANLRFHQSASNVQFWPSVDNLRINEPAVPEPATMLLLGSGLVGLAGFRRKWATKGRV